VYNTHTIYTHRARSSSRTRRLFNDRGKWKFVDSIPHSEWSNVRDIHFDLYHFARKADDLVNKLFLFYSITLSVWIDIILFDAFGFRKSGTVGFHFVYRIDQTAG